MRQYRTKITEETAKETRPPRPGISAPRKQLTACRHANPHPCGGGLAAFLPHVRRNAAHTLLDVQGIS